MRAKPLLTTRRSFLSGSALLGAGLLLPRPARAAQKPIGFIYVGPKMDYGYNYSMDQGRLFVEKTLSVKTLSQENIPESAEVTRVMEKMIHAGCEIIFPTSYGYLDYAIKLGEKYPNVKFLHAGGLKTSANVGTYFANSDDAMYLAGMAAGGTSKSAKLGFVAAFPIPQVLRSINAFTMGAQTLNPKVTTQVVWTGGWLNPAKEAEAANSLADAGVDVIGEQIDSPITLAKTAQKRGIYVVGKDVNVEKFAAKAYLTGASWNWGPMMVSLVKQIWAGTWKPSHVRGDIKDGAAVLDPLGKAVPSSVQKTIADTKKEILDGKRVIWKGPVVGQEGKILVAEGQPMGIQQIETMGYLVKGVLGTVK
jgi:basic membrane lipoprotein Med (substrate-binding protein (PBP1-ABC) superfamily)